MNELISSFAGKRLAAFAALVAAIALLAGGGALSIGTAQAQTGDSTGWGGRGLDHMGATGSINNLRVVLTTGSQHTVCLVDDIDAQQFRADTQSGTPSDGTPGAQTGGDGDVDDLDWDWTTAEANQIDVAAADVGTDIVSGTAQVRGPRGVLTAVPSSSPPAIGWNWVITKKAGTEGTPTVTNPQRRFQNASAAQFDNALVLPAASEACVYWTSTAPGTQVIQLYQGNDLRAAGNYVLDVGSHELATIQAAAAQLEVTWVDADPAILVNRTDATGAAIASAVVTAPISQRMVFTGAGYTAAQVAAGPDGIAGDNDATQDVDESADDDTGRVIPAGAFEPANGNNVGSNPINADPATLVFAVNAYQDPEASDAQLTGASVSFAVTGTCGQVAVPGAAGTGITGGNIAPGQTGAIARWVDAVNVTFSNTGTGAAVCRRASSSTTLTITAGAVTQDVTVNWEWDGYGEFSVDDVNDTTKRVTFHTAVPRTYSRSARPLGWTCDADSQARSVTFDLDGRASVTGFARRNTVGTDGPTFLAVSPTTTGAATPKRTLGATDTECQVSWTVRSPSRAADVYLDITSAGIMPAFSELLSFAPEAPATTTFADFDPPLVPGTDLKRWPGEDTPVGDAVGDSGATAVYEWVAASQSWVSFFPGSEGLGVNTLTMLRTDGFYFIVTPRN